MKTLTDIKQALMDYEQAKPDWLQTGCIGFYMYVFEHGNVSMVLDGMTLSDENELYSHVYQQIEKLAHDVSSDLSGKMSRKQELIDELVQINKELGL